METIINEDGLSIHDINEFNSKVRAILIDENNRILIANYGKVILLPGGSIDNGENVDEAIERELEEELGVKYNRNELDYLTNLKYFQKNYPKRDGSFNNRLIETHYFVGKYKGISSSTQSLTEKEKKDGFALELVELSELEDIVLQNQNNNPRNIYFQNELLTILKTYKDSRKDLSKKLLKK